MTAEAKALISDDNLMKLYNLGVEQGWRIVPTNNGKLMWYPPDKSQNPVTSPNRLHGRTMANVMTQLAKAGLDVSSMKADKSKRASQSALQVVTVDTPLNEDEKRHMEFQNKAKEITAQEMEKMGVRAATELMNSALDIYVANSLKAVLEFAEDTLKVTCGHEVNEDTAQRLEEAERLYLETCEELESERKRREKAERTVSELGQQYAWATQEAAANLERANKAEQKLKAFRDLFKED